MQEKKPLNLSLPVDVIEEIKIVCIKQGFTVSEVVENLMRDYIEEFDHKYAKHESDVAISD